MASGFQQPITIYDAIDKIDNNKYLLPAIQRKFVWKSTQIEKLFDSIMRGYPINSFMLWKITDAKVKKDFKFYEFLKEYRESFKEDNQQFDTIDKDDFSAVIDGQQRLTGIYIGLKGTYAYRMPHKWLKNNEEAIPTRRLYLNILSPQEDEHSTMEYDFRFLTKEEIKDEKDKTNWFLVRDILEYKDKNKLNDFLSTDKVSSDNEFARNTIIKLRERIFDDKLINYLSFASENQFTLRLVYTIVIVYGT